MPSKYCTAAINAFFALTAFVQASAQPAPSPVPKGGYIRFWDMAPPSFGAFELRKMGSPASDPPMLTSSSFSYSSYVDFPVGKYQVAVVKRGDSVPLKSLTIDVRADTFFTVLVSPQNIELVSDTEDPKATSGSIVIRNFFPGLTINASAGGKAITPSLPYGQSYVATGFPFERAEFSLQTTLANGRPASSGAEADLKASKRSTVLVIPDSYGRFRPRVIVDGRKP